VLIHLKNSDNEQFFHVSMCSAAAEDLRKELVQIMDLKKQLEVIAAEAGELATHGLMNGDHDLQEKMEELSVSEGEEAPTDPERKRVGPAPTPELAQVITRTIEESLSCISKDNLVKKTPLTAETLTTSLDNIRGAIMIAYPAGLPDHDVLKGFVDKKSPFEEVDHTKVSLWWANKELVSGPLSKYIGKNEKTTIVVKTTKAGAGPPVREQPVDEETQKAMMSHYFKKQEEQKKLQENSEDDYLNSAWANPKGLKNHFTGLGNVSWR